jgi:hypothetical protein
MDVTSTALTAAWLDAVRRAQSEPVQRLARVAPQTAPAYDERMLTDAIERVLESGGMRPQTDRPAPAANGHKVDIRV